MENMQTKCWHKPIFKFVFMKANGKWYKTGILLYL